MLSGGAGQVSMLMGVAPFPAPSLSWVASAVALYVGETYAAFWMRRAELAGLTVDALEAAFTQTWNR